MLRAEGQERLGASAVSTGLLQLAAALSQASTPTGWLRLGPVRPYLTSVCSQSGHWFPLTGFLGRVLNSLVYSLPTFVF